MTGSRSRKRTKAERLELHRARRWQSAFSQVCSARAHIARGIAAALLLELEDAKRQGHRAALELRDALEIGLRA